MDSIDSIEPTRVAGWLDRSVVFLQTVVAGLLVVLLVVGVVDLGFTIGVTLLAFDVTDPGGIIALTRSAIDIVLYLFVVVELYRTIVAYVEGKNVVVAVIHAGLIGVVRQILIFKPDEYGPTEAITIAGVYVLLLAGLLLGFYLVHREQNDDEEIE